MVGHTQHKAVTTVYSVIPFCIIIFASVTSLTNSNRWSGYKSKVSTVYSQAYEVVVVTVFAVTLCVAIQWKSDNRKIQSCLQSSSHFVQTFLLCDYMGVDTFSLSDDGWAHTFSLSVKWRSQMKASSLYFFLVEFQILCTAFLCNTPLAIP